MIDHNLKQVHGLEPVTYMHYDSELETCKVREMYVEIKYSIHQNAHTVKNVLF